MVKRKKSVRDNSHFGKEHRRLISFVRSNNKRNTLIEVKRLKRKFPRKGRPHWVGDYKNYPVSNIYWDYGICPPKIIDRDGDRAVNWEDCNPRNKYEQGIIRRVITKLSGNKQSSPSLGTIYLTPSESSQASQIAKQSGATVQVVGGSTSNPTIISTTVPSGRTTTTSYGGGSVVQGRSLQDVLGTQAEEVRRLEEAKKQAIEQNQTEEARNLQFAINQAKSSNLKIAQERELKREIQRLDQDRLNAQNKAQLDRILQEKKDKERELRMSQSGATGYITKIALETSKAQQEYNSYLNNEIKKLQAEVNAGNMGVEDANKLLQNRANAKADLVNKNLNSKISSLPVPDALRVPVSTVEAVKPPKGLLNKGITKLKSIPISKTNIDKPLQTQLRGFKELGIGAGIGALSSVKGAIDLPKTLVTLVKNPALIKEIPASFKQSRAELGESLKLSPERTLARIGTEVFLMAKGGEILKRVTGTSKAKLLSKLDDAGVLSRIELKIIRGKVPKITLRIKSVGESLKPVATTKNIRNVAKDVSKLIPKTVSKSKATNLIKLSENTIRAFLRSKKVLKELTLKYPNKTRFTLREIRTIRSYPKLKTVIKRDVLKKYGVQAVRKPGIPVKKGGRRIGGVKVGRKEFRSFKEAEVEFNKLKRLGKFVKKIEQKGGVGRIERLPKRPITAQDLEYFKIGNKIPKQLLKDVKQVEATTFTQKFSARVPVLKRFGDLKNGFWRTIIKNKEFYQNSVSFSLFKKGGKPVGTITFNTISSKPITKFRSLTNALKWGTNKEVVLSKLTGNNFVRSFVLSARGRKITAREFLSKMKVKPNGEFQDISIYTKKIPSTTTRGNIKKQFRESIPVSATKGIIKKVRLPSTITRLKLGKGYAKIIQRGKVVKAIRTKSIINPVIIDTSKIDTVVRTLNSLKNTALSKARLKRLKQFKKFIDETKTSRPFVLNGKKKVIVSEARLKQINRIAKETKGLKESLAGRSIPPRLKVTKRVEGVKELRKLKQVEQSLKKLRNNLIKRNALDLGMKTAIAQSLLLSNKLKQNLKSGQILVSDQRTKQIQTNIQKSLQKSKSKLGLRSINLLRLQFPILSIPPIPRAIRSRVPKVKAPKIRLPSNNREELKFKTFSKPVKIFEIIVKKRGKYITLKDRLIERDALNLMAYELDNQLLRTARLRPLGTSKRARIISPKYNGSFERRRRKLRQFKIRGKKKIPIRGFIEKTKFIRDTPGEKLQLKRLQRKSIRRRKITPSQRRELLKRLEKARRIRQRNLKKRTVKRRK